MFCSSYGNKPILINHISAYQSVINTFALKWVNVNILDMEDMDIDDLNAEKKVGMF